MPTEGIKKCSKSGWKLRSNWPRAWMTHKVKKCCATFLHLVLGPQPQRTNSLIQLNNMLILAMY
jgi:hypothetical protein